MARFITGNTFGTTDNCTAALLNQAVNDAKISTDSVDGSTIELNSDALRLKDAGITTAKIADSSSKTTGVTFAKMQHISTAKVLGRLSASEGDVEEVGVVIGGSGDAGVLFDNDDMLDNSDTAGGSATRGATQQSIKAYVDSLEQYQLKYSGATGTFSSTNSYADLNLSSVVGSNRAMVIMEVFDASSSSNIFFRTKGSSVIDFPGSNQAGWGASATTLSTSNNGGTIVVVTDSSGIIEHTADSSITGINYVIQAYQKLA